MKNQTKSLRFVPLLIGILLLFCSFGSASGETALRSEFNKKGGYQAYLAANLSLFTSSGICDEEATFAHWRDYGRAEGRPFDSGKLRTDKTDQSPDQDFAIDGGFCWEYQACGHPTKTLVFITKDAPKPAGWDGRNPLLKKGDLFNLGPNYSALAYRQLNPDVANAIDLKLIPSFASVTDHYVKYGFKEGRLTNGQWTQSQLEAWDDAAYLMANPDVNGFFMGAQSEGWRLLGKIGFAHFMNFGDFEGRATGQIMSGEELQLQIQRKFDESAYLGRNPDVANAVANGIYASGREHFEQFGKCDYSASNDNRRPNDFLNSAYYLQTNPDVAAAIPDVYPSAWDHWWALGAKQGLAGLPVQVGFDAQYYVSRYQELTALIGPGKLYPSPLIHYIQKGQRDGNNPNAHFDEQAYLKRNSDLADSISKGFYSSGYDHFQQYGKYDFAKGNKNRRPNDYFDNEFYLAIYADVSAQVPDTYATAWDHWIMIGATEGRAALPVEIGFDENYYLIQYPELQPLIGDGKLYPSARVHYIDAGQKEGRNPNSIFDEKYYMALYELKSAVESGIITSGYDHYQKYGKSNGYRTLRAINGVLSVGKGHNDYATIQDAVNAALDGEEIRIPAGVYTDGAFGIFNKSLKITGSGKTSTFLQPGVKLDPSVKENTGGGICVLIGSGNPKPVVTIKGITFQYGDNRLERIDYKEGVAGAITARNVRLLLSDCDFIENKSHTGGALIFENSQGSTIENCEFLRNSAQRDGGAIASIKDGVSLISNCMFKDNIMEERPYNYVHDGDKGTHKSPGFSAVGVPYTADSPAKDGEFYDRFDTGPFKVSFQPVVGPAFVGYYAGPLGGAVALNSSNPLIKNNTFINNRANFAGGAIYMIDGAAPTIDSNIFNGNQSSRGGAIYSESGAVTAIIKNNEIVNNSAPADSNYPGSGKGGGIALYYKSSPEITDNNIFHNNSADYGGGAIGIYEESSATIVGNSFKNNMVKSKSRGGLIPASDGVNTLDQFGLGAGGAIDVEVGNAIISKNTVLYNEARLGGGIFVVGTGTISENIISGNKAVADAIGTFDGDQDMVGSAIFLSNPVASGSIRKASIADNVFSGQNAPYDIVETGFDLEFAFSIDQPGANVFSFDF